VKQPKDPVEPGIWEPAKGWKPPWVFTSPRMGEVIW